MAIPGLEDTLLTGLRQLTLDVPVVQQDALLAYIELLATWNKSFNLTAIRNPREMVNMHLLDALVALPYLPSGAVLDVGSGAGLPGIPLAITRPDQHFTLLDSNGKKIRFIKQAVITLQLANVDVVQSRVEDYQPAEPFDLIVSRAFSSLEQLVRLTRHLLKPHGAWLAWKGELDDDETQAVSELVQIGEVIPIQLPGVSNKRQLVKMTL